MWLIDTALHGALQKAYEAKLNGAVRIPVSLGPVSRNKGRTAQIAVSGLLTQTPDIMAYFLGEGNTTYADINAALIAAEDSESIDNIELIVDSPGGNSVGLFNVIETLQMISKPTTAIVTGTAASAAYGIASAADRIVATSKSSSVGSIGVATEMYISDNIVTLTSTEAPKKRPDVKTDEGKADIIEHLDEMHDLFVGMIADGRKTTKDKINANYGRGATMLAERALKHGMIDSIESKQKRGEQMKLETLKAEHPELCAQLQSEGAATASTDAVVSERARIEQHLELAEKAGDASLALPHIKSGVALTSEVMGFYMEAAQKANFSSDRADDNPDLPDGQKPAANQSSEVFKILAHRRGVTLNG